MARRKTGPVFHLMPLVEVIGWKEAIRQLGVERVIDELASDKANRMKHLLKLVKRMSPDEKEDLIRELTQKKRRES